MRKAVDRQCSAAALIASMVGGAHDRVDDFLAPFQPFSKAARASAGVRNVG
ncbi:MAG: hypothetical protein ACLQKK_15300 [Rhodomicrobium sp.]